MKLKENILALKKYWQIIYAVFLIILIPLAIIFNTVWITNSFKKNIDLQLQRQALSLAEVFNGVLERQLDNIDELQAALDRIAERNGDVRMAEILVPADDDFKIVASLITGQIGTTTKNIELVLAWHNNQAIAKLTTAALVVKDDPLGLRQFEDPQERFWSVTVPLLDQDGQKKALLSLNMSLSVVDNLVQKTLIRAYLILAVAVIIVMLLLVANTRLFQYAVVAKKLKEIEKLKDEFISMASHELRTPITSLRGYLTMLSDGSLGKLSKLAQEKVTMMVSSADRLSDLVEDLLNVSRIEQGRMIFELERLDIVPIIEEVMDELKVQAKENGLKFEYKKPKESLPELLLDSNRFKQILLNIIGNAIKYTPKGSVTITSIYVPGDKIVEIKCADTGLGMTGKQREKLFSKFYRVKTGETQHIKGTGLGLWITKQLVELMNGRIFVDSIEEVGSEFNIHFPVKSEKEIQQKLIKQKERLAKESETQEEE